jgi:hypothetical protein
MTIRNIPPAPSPRARHDEALKPALTSALISLEAAS